MKTYNIVLKQKPLDEGLSIEDITEMLKKVSCVEVFPIEVQAQNSVAMGFISVTSAELIDYDYTKLEEFVQQILDDKELEHENNEYLFFAPNVATFSMYMDY